MSRFVLLPAFVGLGMLASLSVLAGDAVPNPSPNVSQSVAPNEHQAIGKVTASAGSKITIAHGPIPSLKWPAMEMGFALSAPEIARDIAVGDTVNFAVVQRGRDYVVTRLSKRTP